MTPIPVSDGSDHKDLTGKELKKKASSKEETSLTNPIVAQKNQIVMPVVNATEAVEAWEAYEELKDKIVKSSDLQVIGKKKFLKKSYWRKLATFFNLSIETVSESKEILGKTIVWHFTIRATAPNSRFVEGIGSCDVYEKASLIDGKYQDSYGKKAKPNSLHNVRSTAYTRAYNRAVSDLVGGGEVSAEEVEK